MAAFAKRILATDVPVMVQVQELLRGAGGDVLSLAQGVVYWKPPQRALDKIKDAIYEPSTSHYGPDEGLPALREALMLKVKRENNLHRSAVMITAGANQAYANVALSLCDPEDAVVMFAPYYFNAYTTYQMTGIRNIIVGPSDPDTCHPDPEWLEHTLRATDGGAVPKIVNIVNPGNPSGTYVSEHLLKRIADICKHAGAWLIVDNTYEYFMYDNRKHTCVEGDHIIHIFSFSKAYGMMGWRVGYIAYPVNVPGLEEQLLKVQDNVPICASIVGQKLALAVLEEAGPEWVRERVDKLSQNRAVVLDAFSPLGQGAVKGGEGALYFWVRLPDGLEDTAVVKWLATKHSVMVVPGSASGGKGHIRVSYGGLDEETCKLAAKRLKAGLEELVRSGTS